MFCTSCGALIEDGLNFCSQCGSPINNNAQPYTSYQSTQYQPTETFNAPPVHQTESTYAPAQNTYQNMYQNAQPIYNQYQNPPTYNQPGYSGYASPYAGLERPKRDPGKVCGILSLIFSLVGYPFLICYGVGLIYWLAALILGGIGLRASKRNGFKNGRAKAGIIITLVPLIVTIVACIIALFVGLFVYIIDSM